MHKFSCKRVGAANFQMFQGGYSVGLCRTLECLNRPYKMHICNKFKKNRPCTCKFEVNSSRVQMKEIKGKEEPRFYSNQASWDALWPTNAPPSYFVNWNVFEDSLGVIMCSFFNCMHVLKGVCFGGIMWRSLNFFQLIIIYFNICIYLIILNLI
jgi:hypothetical protein